MPDPNSEDEELRAMMDMKMEVLEFHYREREAENNGITTENGLNNRNSSNSSNYPQQPQPEKNQGNSVNSAKKNNFANSKNREKQNIATNSRRKEPASITASQLPVYSVKSPNNPEAESTAQLKKRKKKISEKAVEDEFEFPLAKRKTIKREPDVEDEKVRVLLFLKTLI